LLLTDEYGWYVGVFLILPCQAFLQMPFGFRGQGDASPFEIPRMRTEDEVGEFTAVTVGRCSCSIKLSVLRETVLSGLTTTPATPAAKKK
jgi:hypothetical protein